MAQTGYPLHVMHGYVIRAKEALEFSRLVRRVHPETLSQIEVVNAARRPLLPYAALVLEHIIREAEPRDVVFSALGVREGLLYSLLDAEERKADPLLAAARELNLLRSRSPQHGEELIAWTDAFMATSGIDENAEEKRLRHAACLLADIGWRAHPDYRGEQSLNIIAHAAFVGIDHPGRAYLALAIFFRHVGLLHDEELSPRIRELASTRTLDRARVLGAALRVAYLVSASQPGVLARTPLKVERHRLVLRLEGECAALAGERLSSRLKQLARLSAAKPVVVPREWPTRSSRQVGSLPARGPGHQDQRRRGPPRGQTTLTGGVRAGDAGGPHGAGDRRGAGAGVPHHDRVLRPLPGRWQHDHHQGRRGLERILAHGRADSPTSDWRATSCSSKARRCRTPTWAARSCG